MQSKQSQEKLLTFNINMSQLCPCFIHGGEELIIYIMWKHLSFDGPPTSSTHSSCAAKNGISSWPLQAHTGQDAFHLTDRMGWVQLDWQHRIVHHYGADNEGHPCAPWYTTQAGGAQRRSVVHNIVLTVEVVHNIGLTNPHRQSVTVSSKSVKETGRKNRLFDFFGLSTF